MPIRHTHVKPAISDIAAPCEKPPVKLKVRISMGVLISWLVIGVGNGGKPKTMRVEDMPMSISASSILWTAKMSFTRQGI